MNHSTAHDFDFLMGDWQVAHQRLRERLVGCTEWQHFTGTCRMQPVLGGAGNVDDNLLHLPEGSYRAVSLRAFDAATRRWSIWWLDGRHPDRIDVPVVGGFDAGLGSFFASDVIQGQVVRVRFSWLDTHTTTPRWEQAFSVDGGQSWEINWNMTFTRAVVGP
jgi:hypothetical protein